MPRLFFALPISPSVLQPVLDALKKQQHPSSVRWSPPENWHLTLRFLGEVSPEKINRCIAQLEKILQPITSFEFDLKELMLFPMSCPRLLVIQVPLSSALAKLHDVIEKAMLEMGFQPDRHDFFPHVTLGKLQHSFQKDEFVSLQKKVIFKPLNQQAKGVILFESKLRPEGSIYSALHEFSLR